MYYRRLGRTNRQVSLLGVGGGYVVLLEQEEGTRLYERARELGINYFDGRYGATSTMLKPVIKRGREECIVVSKTADLTRDGAAHRIDEDLAELDTDYIDIYYLRTYNMDMLQAHLGPGGSMEALVQAKAEGKIRAIGLAGHSDMSALARGIETGLVDAVIFPLNVVRRDALDDLVPTAIQHDVGLVVMKPVNAGLTPAEIALPWLANQPIHTMAPGVSNLEMLERNVAILERPTLALTPAEERLAEQTRADQDSLTCRICDHLCHGACEQDIRIDALIYHDVWYNELRTLGVEGLLATPLSDWFKATVPGGFQRRLETLQRCTRCGACERACPHGLPIMAMFDKMIADYQAVIEAAHEAGWDRLPATPPPFGRGG